jgi:hypothetical protein
VRECEWARSLIASGSEPHSLRAGTTDFVLYVNAYAIRMLESRRLVRCRPMTSALSSSTRALLRCAASWAWTRGAPTAPMVPPPVTATTRPGWAMSARARARATLPAAARKCAAESGNVLHAQPCMRLTP